MTNLKNKIDADDKNIQQLLKDQKFTIDYFQREYRWQEKHIKLLIEDLTSNFLKSYQPNHQRKEVANYQSYYLGSVIFSNVDGKKSIVDGQQRITSITLFLIYLNHLQKNSEHKVSLTDLIFSEKYGEKSFNMSDEQREPCLKALFEKGEYDLKEDDDETVKNLVYRYEDITNSFPSFPENIDEEKVLPFFIDWFIEKVVLVEITSYSDENAYNIFETMNDRGLNLTQAEMLKGFILSKISNKTYREEINDIWRREIQKLLRYEGNKELSFFQAWFRAKYAETMRPGKAGAEDQDFELIGSRFHSWFKEKHVDLFKLKDSDDFYKFFKEQFPFFVKVYLEILDTKTDFSNDIPHINYINQWGIADSLQEPLLLATINCEDSKEIICKKIDFIARYIETFTVKRAINYKKFGQTSIRYTMFNVIKKVRKNSDIHSFASILSEEIKNIPEKFDGICDFRLHGQNKFFVKHLLSRISSYIDNIIGNENVNYAYYHHPKGKQFEIEHIWGNNFEMHKYEFEQENDFQLWRNSIGALLLLPNGTNQSFKDESYENKLPHYLKQNTFAQTLHKEYYKKNPNFLNSKEIKELNFSYHEQFNKNDITERQKLVKRICEKIWSIDYFNV